MTVLNPTEGEFSLKLGNC